MKNIPSINRVPRYEEHPQLLEIKFLDHSK